MILQLLAEAEKTNKIFKALFLITLNDMLDVY